MQRAIRWWPPIAVAAMLLLGWAVGKGSTPLDDWFRAVKDFPRWLLVVVDWRWLVLVVVIAVAAALRRQQWRLAAVILLGPPVAIVVARALKRAFGRDLGGDLAYPSGHATALVAVLGMVVLVSGGRRWVLAVAVAVGLVGIVGIGVTFHYFTDTIGGLLLGSAVVCGAAVIAGWAPAVRGSPVATGS